jgi:transposase
LLSSCSLLLSLALQHPSLIEATVHVLGLPRLDATHWRAELAIPFGVILRKVWGGSRTWIGARTQAILISVWRTCWQHGINALDFLSELLRSQPLLLPQPR